jgi:regulator of protease activity HflC (stomatin/prohibitin superfamily)
MTIPEIFEALIKFCPRLETVGPDEVGLLIRCGKVKRKLEPGWLFCLPYFDVVEKVIGTRQTVAFSEISVKSLDDKFIAVSGSVLYTVSDAEKTIVNIDDQDEYLAAEISGRVSEFISKRREASITNESIKAYVLEESFKNHIKNESGLLLRKIHIHDLTPHKVIRLMTNGGTVNQGE